MTGFRVDTATSPPQLTSIDMEEVILEAAAGQSLIRYRRGGTSAFGVGLWTGFGGGFKEPSTLNGYLWRRIAGGAAVAAGYFIDGGYDHPMGADLTTDPPGYTRPVRWTLQGIMHRLNNTQADLPCWSSVAAILQALRFTTEEGFEISSDPGVNGGNWTVRRRLVSAGAILDVDTGIGALTDVFWEIIYESTTDPVLFARVNGTEFGRVQGLANIPQRPARTGNQTSWNIANGYGSNSSAGGGTDHHRGFRMLIEELPGFV